MTVDYKITKRQRGYENKQDETLVDSRQKGVMLPPSKNVIVTAEGLVQSRAGMEKFGDALSPDIEYTEYWQTNRDFNTTLTVSDKKLYASYEDDWVYIGDVANNDVTSAVWWDRPKKKDITIFTEGTNSLKYWDGVLGKMDTIDDDKFYSDVKEISNFGVRVGEFLTINGEDYEVMSYEPDNGVKLDRTISGVVGDYFAGQFNYISTFDYTYIETAHDTPVTMTGRDLYSDFGFTFDVIAVNKNQITCGSHKMQRVFESTNNDWTKFTYNTDKGRIKGEGNTYVLDAPVKAIEVEPFKGRLVVSCSTDQVYEIKDVDVTVNGVVNYTNTTQSINQLLSGFDSAFNSKYGNTLVKDSLAFISADATVNTLNRIDHLDTRQGKPLSYLIHKEFTKDNIIGSKLLFIKNVLYVALPKVGKILMYDFELEIWQPPVTVPVSTIGIKDGELFYFDITGQAHWMFKGTNDDEIAISQRAVFSYEDANLRATLKKQHKNYTEGYLSEGGEIEIKLVYDFAGTNGIHTRTISKENNQKKIGRSITKFFSYGGSFGIGRYGFGKVPMGGSEDEYTNGYSIRVSKFRDFFESTSPIFFEQRFEVFTDKKDTVFGLIAFGQNTTVAKTDPDKI